MADKETKRARLDLCDRIRLCRRQKFMKVKQYTYIYIYVCAYIYICMCARVKTAYACVKKDGDPRDKERNLGMSHEVDINFLRVDVDARYYNRRGNIRHINGNKNDSICRRFERR